MESLGSPIADPPTRDARRGGQVAGPPAYAWDWFARQRLVWSEARRRIAGTPGVTALRYREATIRGDVLALLRADYPRDPIVRREAQAAVSEIAFLDRTDVPFAELGVRNAPRGMRWWWSALTGEPVGAPLPVTGPAPVQLELDEVHEGYGG